MDIARGRVVRERVDDLLRRPFAPGVPQHDPEHAKKQTRLDWGRGPEWTEGGPSYAERRPVRPRLSAAT